MSKLVNKALDWIVKVAGICVTTPATWQVATNLFSELSPYPEAYLIVRIAAVVLVEGVMLSNWLLLETDKTALPIVKTRYALTALGMYIGMWVLALEHGEGIAGLVIRGSLLAALLGSGWNVFAETWAKLDIKTDKDVANSWSVKRHRRKAAVTIEKLEIDNSVTIQKRLKAAEMTIELARIVKEEKQKLSEGSSDIVNEIPELPANIVTDNDDAIVTRPAKQRQIRSHNVVRTSGNLDQMILDNLMKDGQLSDRELATIIGKNRETIRLRRLSLVADNKIYRNGKGYKVTIEGDATDGS